MANWSGFGQKAQNVKKEAQIEKGGVRVRALLTKRPLDLKEVAVK